MKAFPLNPVTYYDTFPAFLDGIERDFGPKPALSWFTRRREEVTLTFTQLVAQVQLLCRGLARQGLSGKHIAIIGENSCQWLLAYLAITAQGGVAVCIDAEQSVDTIHQMLRLAQTEAAFVSPSYLDICGAVLPTERLFLLQEGEAPQGVRTLGQLSQQGEDWAEPQPVSVAPTQTAAIAFTSGTTSLAKPVMLTQRGLLHNASDSIRYVATGERVFTALPFYHTYGMTCGALSSLVNGVQLFINGDLKTVMRDMKQAQANTLMTVPLVIEAIYNQLWLAAEKEGKSDALRRLLGLMGWLRRLHLPVHSKKLGALREKAFGTLRIIITGGAYLGEEIERELDLLGIQIMQGYGITECSPLVSVNSNHSRRFGSVGHVMPSCQVKLVEEEIWVRGCTVMAGYYNAPEATAEVMEGEWFKTGDLGYLDKDGFLFITGRKKSLIVFKNGKKVSPEKMEELLGALPLVKEVLVTGAVSGNSADDVKLAASIYPDPQRSAGMEPYEVLAQLQAGVDAINATLPLYQQIQMMSVRDQEFAKTGTKKIKRNAQ